jgi:ArsR family transcriptional regulator, arsenate/arsenite/antimonite-responsive transcriptional repressor
MRDLAILFSALADPTRLQMLALLLCNDELCVCDFVETLGISQSKASRHLRYLWNARLLEDRRAGLWVHYRICPALDPERDKLVNALSQVFEKRDLSELKGKLELWVKRKARSTTCSVAPVRKPPARAPAKTRKPRPAAEARR